MKSVAIIILLQFCAFAILLGGDSSSVLSVNSANDQIRTVAWKSGMNLLDIIILTNAGPDAEMACVISSGSIRTITKLKRSVYSATTINPGDVIVWGPLTPSREAKLRKNPNIDALFKTLPPSSLP